jgi:Fic-DOC domain mobile mystery protein B
LAVVTGADDQRSEPWFNIRTIGPEPLGATPIDDHDLDGLIPDWVATRADLNQVELENIAKHLPVAFRHARAGGPESVLDYGFMLDLHRHMFEDVWRWAGILRRRETIIGADPAMIAQLAAQAFADARYWHANDVFLVDERAARIHGRLVDIHPFRNGNGRCTRLVADLYLTCIGQSVFTWGAASRPADGTTRGDYLADLLHALETDDYARLVAFARS